MSLSDLITSPLGPPRPATCPVCGLEIPTGQQTCLACADTVAGGEARPTPSGRKEIAGFVILRELGAGGMGTVYEAIEQKMNRRVALKILGRHHSPSAKAEARFEREAWIAGKLNHPNLVKVYERGTWEDISFYSMELVEGGSLYDVVQNLRKWGRDEAWGLKFGTRECTAWAITQIVAAAQGLDYAHRQGVIHRDVKPMNLLLTRDPVTVKVTDFGLAMEPGADRLTTTGRIMGTLAYMAPEQLLGKKDQMDARTDVYSLGASLYEMLTLERPFKGDDLQTYAHAVLTTQAGRPSRINEKVSRDLDVVIGKALEKDPKDRYPSAAAFAEDLENVLSFRPIVASPPSTPTRVVKWARRKPALAGALAAALILLPVGSSLTLRAIQHQRLLTRLELEEQWQQARRLTQDGRMKEALPVLSRMLQLDQNHVPALRARSLCFEKLALAEQDPARRQEFVNLALADSAMLMDRLPGVSWPYRLSGYLLREFDRQEEADRAFESARLYQREPPSVDDLSVEGTLAYESGDPAGAVKALSEVLNREPGRVNELVYRAKAHEQLNDLISATVDLQVAAGLAPTDFIPRYELGRLSAKAGHLDKAEPHFRQALRIDPRSANARTGLADVNIQRGKILASSGDLEGAKRAFVEAQSDAGTALQLDAGLGWAHLDLAVSLMEQNRLLPSADQALLRTALDHNEQVISLWRKRGGRPEEEDYQKALVNVCDTLIQLGDLERALASCLEVVEHKPGEAIGFYNLAGVYALLGRRQEALEALEKDLALGDTDWKYLASDRWLESLRADPWFKALLGKMKRASSG